MMEQENEIIDQICINYRLNWWIIFNRQKLSDTNQGHQFNCYVFDIDQLDEDVEVSELKSHFVGNVISEYFHMKFVLCLECYSFVD